MKTKKFLSIHAHFYQPPRENPWAGEIEPQNSAIPYDNWNHRIAMECYFPNLFGRIKNYKGETLEMINNYEHLNFNFGPTLLSWLELKYPIYYRMIIETAMRVKEKKGFPNVIAQSYNHTILPLDNFQDRLTQIRWGIKDFSSRFGFYPEGLWLPETAVNEDILRLLIDNKIKYVILAPYQLKSAINLKTKEITNNIDNKLHYVWFDRDQHGTRIPNRSLTIFTYDSELSRKVAFENVTSASAAFADAVNSTYDRTRETPQLTLIAADGETYGHHRKFADMTLSHAFRHELAARKIEVVNLSEYLSLHPPTHQAELNPGQDGEGTAWSCAHGIRRWKGGCSCGDEGKYQTSWRLPLRSALTWLRTVLADIFSEEGKNLFKNPWNARDEYIDLMLDRSGEALEHFFERNSTHPLSPEERQKAIRLLMMQKYSMFMFTSCGWFFSDISRIESQQNLRYAAIAAEIAQSFGFKGIERAFVSLLEMANSNFRNFANGRRLYETLVKPASIPENKIIAFIAIRNLTGMEKPAYENQKYSFRIKELRKTLVKGIEVKAGVMETLDKDFKSLSQTHFAVLFKPNTLPEFYFLQESLKGADFSLEENLEALKTSEKVLVPDLPRFMQKLLADRFISKIKYDNYWNMKKMLLEYAALLENEGGPSMDIFENIAEEVNIYLKQLLGIKIKELLLGGDEKILGEISALMAISEKFKIFPKLHNTPDIINLMPEFVAAIHNGDFKVEELLDMKTVFYSMGLGEFSHHIENYLEIIKETQKTQDKKAEAKT